MGLKKIWKTLTSIIISATPDSTKKRGKNVQGDNNKQSISHIHTHTHPIYHSDLNGKNYAINNILVVKVSLEKI